MISREQLIAYWINCLLVKEGLREGYISDLSPELNDSDFFLNIPKNYFGLHTFKWHNNLLITKDMLSDETKEKIVQGYEFAKARDPRQREYHSIIGNILGYDCVGSFSSYIDAFSKTNVTESRVAFNFSISLINNSKIILFPYVCPGIIANSQITVAQENIDRAIRYLNEIQRILKDNAYTNLVVQKISLDISYSYPFPSRHINQDLIMSKGVPIPPFKHSGSDETSQSGASVPIAPTAISPAEIAMPPSSTSGGKRKKQRRTKLRHSRGKQNRSRKSRKHI